MAKKATSKAAATVAGRTLRLFSRCGASKSDHVLPEDGLLWRDVLTLAGSALSQKELDKLAKQLGLKL